MSKLEKFLSVYFRVADEISDDKSTLQHPELSKKRALAIVQYPEPYVQPLIIKALRNASSVTFDVVEKDVDLQHPDRPVVSFKAYEDLDFDHAAQYSSTSLTCAYIIRKALIRKHFLSSTVTSWLVKHPDSLLKDHFKSGVHFELDYAEFLDDALVDAWDLHESMDRNALSTEPSQKEWWILKPGMSDGGNEIRLFSTMEDLQAIFDDWDPPSDDEEDEAEDTTNPVSVRGQAAMTSQLRHFIVQPYINDPLLLPEHGNRKFHIRTYVLAVGALKVYVCREMLALFAAKPYQPPHCVDKTSQIDLSQHLTNTCFQDESTKALSVCRYWDIDEPTLDLDWRESIFSQICEVTGEVFEAAAREQMVHFQAIPNAFEIFGVDFLVDHNRNVWLLELNAYPDFKQTGESLQDQVIGSLFDGVVEAAVLPFFGVAQHTAENQQMVLVREIDLGRK